jgi:NRAMP (natural resistance-associated macrophage protein)-like metal ion transporter
VDPTTGRIGVLLAGDVEGKSAAAGRRTRRKARSGGLKKRLIAAAHDLGPGVITGAADDDPSGIATYSQAGAQFGYGLLWTMLLTFPLMSAVQLVSAHIGRVTGQGLARNLVSAFPKGVVLSLVGLLVVANAINIGADLSAMGASAELVTGGGRHWFVIAFAVGSMLLQLFIPYHRYARILKWMTLSLLAYVGVLLVVRTDWAAALRGLVWPSQLQGSAALTIVALFGTTISPYLFFWQSAQEAEEIVDTPGGRPLKDVPRAAKRQFRRMRVDTIIGMAFSNVIAMIIILATAATLHAHGITRIDTASEAAEALRPIAGRFAFLLFAMGIIGTGLLAVPVLAGSAAFAVSETGDWKRGLEYMPGQAMRFYGLIAGATLLGIAFDWISIDPVKALFWSAVFNGLAAVPLMGAMMVLVARRTVMGRFTAAPLLSFFGWAATAVMGAAAAALIVQVARA